MDALTLGVVLSTLVLLIFLLSMIWPPDSPWSPWWRTNTTVARTICRIAKIGKEDFVIDLGCGDGLVLFTAAKEYGAKGLGIEIDPLRVYHAVLRMQLGGVTQHITIRRQNLFETDITPATVIIVYLVPKTLARLEAKFREQLKPGTRVVSYMYQIPYLTLIAKDTKHKIFVYEMPAVTSKLKRKNTTVAA